MLLGQVCCLILIFLSILKIIASGQNTTIILLFHTYENVKAQSVRNANDSQICVFKNWFLSQGFKYLNYKHTFLFRALDMNQVLFLSERGYFKTRINKNKIRIWKMCVFIICDYILYLDKFNITSKNRKNIIQEFWKSFSVYEMLLESYSWKKFWRSRIIIIPQKIPFLTLKLALNLFRKSKLTW